MASFTSPYLTAAKRALISLGFLATLTLSAISAQAQPDFITFESGHVRPLAMTPDGNTLLAVNTPDNTLEVFSNVAGELTHTDSIPVGMEPVAVAARNNSEVWVVNHLSDSVSVIDLTTSPARVVRTLLVGDEPRDIVFAGTGGTDRAFITTAHRGQHLDFIGGDPELSDEGVGRADVWVFNANSLGNDLGGTPFNVLTFFSDTPRALAVTPDRSTVYVAALFSGNQTTVINETQVCDRRNNGSVNFGTCPTGAPGAQPGPINNVGGERRPEAGVIVKFVPNGPGTSDDEWLDAAGQDWSALVPFNLPDNDVFSFNANTLASVDTFSSVGTILFNMVVHPTNGKVYVTNTELPNDVIFEGPGVHGGSTVQGRLSESRITVLDPSGPSVDPQHLNKHINYSNLHTDAGADHAAIEAQKAHSLATPLQPVVNAAGDTLYVAAFGSARIGVFSTAQIEAGTFNPVVDSANYIDTLGGPSGMVLDEANDRLYVMTRFSNTVEVIDLNTNNSVDTHKLHNPEPSHVVDGRPFLYDANLTSGNGEPSCSSCHIFGDMDHLAWNLGDPDGAVSVNNQPAAIPAIGQGTELHPMKGPMTTQTLRGMATHGSLHWRGDRVDGPFSLGGSGACSEVVGAPCSEELGFKNFIVAFEGLVGMHGTVSNAEMQQFTDFALELMLPPNLIRPLSNSLSGDAAQGDNLFFNLQQSDNVATCNGCHTLNPSQGFFGTGGEQSFENEPQFFKVAHMRNMYNKVGMFSTSGDQVRGFGFLHDGSVDTIITFLEAPVFPLDGGQRVDLEAFSHQFPTDLAPIVGQQITLTASSPASVGARIDLMIQRASTAFDSLLLGNPTAECDVIVKGSLAGVERGAVRLPSGQFQTDIAADPLATDAQIRSLATTDGPLTYTCVPPGSGVRMGINRDRDNLLDGDDNCPANPNNGQADDDSDGIGNACDPDWVPTGC